MKVLSLFHSYPETNHYWGYVMHGVGVGLSILEQSVEDWYEKIIEE